MTKSRLIGLKDLIAAAKPGECIFCGEPAKRRSTAYQAAWRRKKAGTGDYYQTCGEPECAEVAYSRYYKRDLKAQKQSKNTHMSVLSGTPSP